MIPRVHYLPDSAALAQHVCQGTELLANQCIAANGRFIVVLSGGSTPAALYRRLGHIKTDWHRWHIYFGDERYLPPGHPERNDTLARQTWLDHVAIPAAQIYAVPDAGSVYAAAAAYDAMLQQTPRFDLVLLGLGEDGHTASLFPGPAAHANGLQHTIAVSDAPKPPAERISMNAQRLSEADAIWFLVTGEAKRAALTAWLGGAELPPKHIAPVQGVDIFTDIEQTA